MYPIFIAGALLVSEPAITHVAHSVTEIGEGTFSAPVSVNAAPRPTGDTTQIGRRCKIDLGVYLWSSSASRLKHDARLKGALIELTWCYGNLRRHQR